LGIALNPHLVLVRDSIHRFCHQSVAHADLQVLTALLNADLLCELNKGESPMDTSHAMALEAKHAGIDQRIAEEYRRPVPNPTIISRLKKEKLRIKEALTRH
jgi:hypothetical protein